MVLSLKVPVEVLQSFGPYNQGEIVGLEPEHARRLIEQEYAKPAEKRGDVYRSSAPSMVNKDGTPTPASRVNDHRPAKVAEEKHAVRMNRGWGIYNQDEVAAFGPKLARELVMKGVARPLQPDEDDTSPVVRKAPDEAEQNKMVAEPVAKKGIFGKQPKA